MTKKATSEMFSDEALHFGSIAHYLDGAEYSAAYRRRTADVRWYLALADKLRAKKVLELGGGAGRVAIPLARQGHTVLAVDAVEGMIDEGRARLSREKADVQARVTFALDDLRTFKRRPSSEDTPFDLVIAPFNVMQHLYSRQDWEAALGVVTRHLTPKKGRFAFDITMPDLRAFVRDPARPYKCRPVRDMERNVIVQSAESFAYDPVAQIQLVTTMSHDEGALETAYLKALAHRQVFPQELETLLHYNGFTVLERFGDFDGGPLDENAESQVIVAKLR
jgi:SAM-dependent methyltransferase